MANNNFVGVRLDDNLSNSISAIMKKDIGFKSITELVKRGLTLLISEVEGNGSNPMSHPDYPDLIKLAGSIESKDTQNFLYTKLQTLEFSEITTVYNWLKR